MTDAIAGKCEKCGKELETMGLNRSYPPKKDDMGRVICPHCGHVHGSFRSDPRATGFNTYVPGNLSTKADPSDRITGLPPLKMDIDKLKQDLDLFIQATKPRPPAPPAVMPPDPKAVLVREDPYTRLYKMPDGTFTIVGKPIDWPIQSRGGYDEDQAGS